MKHTKKLVSVPENEYNALLGMLSGNDPIKKEKFLTDQKIAATFSKPASPIVRGAHYQALSRKRRMLNKKIEEKPIRVLMEQGKNAVLPTSGIAPAAKPPQQIQDLQQQQQQEVQPEAPAAEPAEEEAPAARRTRAENVEKYHNLIDKNKLQRLKIRVDGFKDFFGINDRGEILKDKNKDLTKIKDSDYMQVLQFLTGNIELPQDQKHAIQTLIPRLLKDDGVKELISKDKKTIAGSGKRRKYVVDLKPIKTTRTRGLTRFKPILWSKIPV
jgi:hypothetical protein